jgi:L-lactate dehydrogenase complex protein LldF
MQPTARAFPANAAAAIADPDLQKALGRLKGHFIDKRAQARARLPEFDALRDQAKAIKDHTLGHLDLYLERFEARVQATGGTVHWCRDAAEARQAVLAICRAANARTVTKGKTMIAEEIGLNPFLEANGIQPVETDLG